jgi:spore coat protein U-like protein
MKRMARFFVPPFVLAASLFAVESSALAGSASSNMTVSATVSNNCTISAGALAFGTYDPVSANAAADLTGTATLTVACTSGGSATIDLDQGLHAAGGSTATVPLRQLDDGAAHDLAYFLYQDANRSTVWGAAAASAAYTGTGAATSVTVYGKVTAGQNVPAASYSDTVVATINF